MGPWVRLLGLFAAIVLATLFLKILPPVIVLGMLIGGIVYLNHTFVEKPKRERSKTTAQLLGLRAFPDGTADIAAAPFALLGRPGAQVRDVMAGPWRGRQVRLFDLETMSSAPVAGSDGLRGSTCVIAPLALRAPHLVVEPQAFLTAAADRPALPTCAAGSERVTATCDVRCEDPAFASSFLRDGVADWLLEQADRVAFEMHGETVLLYMSRLRTIDRDQVLEALQGFLDAVANRGE